MAGNKQKIATDLTMEAKKCPENNYMQLFSVTICCTGVANQMLCIRSIHLSWGSVIILTYELHLVHEREFNDC